MACCCSKGRTAGQQLTPEAGLAIEAARKGGVAQGQSTKSSTAGHSRSPWTGPDVSDTQKGVEVPVQQQSSTAGRNQWRGRVCGEEPQQRGQNGSLPAATKETWRQGTGAARAVRPAEFLVR